MVKKNKKVIKKFKDLLKIIRDNPFTFSSLFVLFMLLTVPYLVFISEYQTKDANIISYSEGLWWGIVTVFTVGYGDRYPITLWGRIWASFMMFGGMAGIAILTAKISSVFLEKALRDRRGLVDTELLNSHFIVCGWKYEMHVLLLHILDSNPGLTADKIILVNNVGDELLDSLHEFARLKKIKIIKGDFFSPEVLKRAAPHRAEKILILADSTPTSTGQIPTRSEADARTIMAAMTLNTIAKGTAVAAEILESQMDQYLKLANVHEIIYSRDYSRLLLALASTATGITNVFHDLLDPSSSYVISTDDLPSEAYNKTYEQLKKIFSEKHPEVTLLGILENSGNSHVAKEVALKKAQETPNVKQLVENLHRVKTLRYNRPVFSPKNDYIINEGSMAIVIKEREKHGKDLAY